MSLRVLGACVATLVACTPAIHRSPSVRPVAPLTVALDVDVGGGVRAGCLRGGTDSSTFTVHVVADSLTSGEEHTLELVRTQRRLPSAQYTYQNVSIDVRRTNERRVIGFWCAQETGMVLRGPSSALRSLRIEFDPPAVVHGYAWDPRGRMISDSLTSRFQNRTERLVWRRR